MSIAGSELTPLSGPAREPAGDRPVRDASHPGDAAFRLLADAMPQIVWTMQPDGLHTYFNQRWLDYSGASLQDSLVHGWSRSIHPDDCAQVTALWTQARASHEACEVECRLRRVDGVYRWMLGRAVPQRDAAGRPVGWVGTLTDIDELRQRTELLDKNLYMSRIAGRVARLGGWTIDLPERTLTWSDENCLIHDVAPGYTPTLDEGIGYFSPEHQPLVTSHVQNCAENGVPYEFVLPKCTATGRRIWVRSMGEAVRDASGKIVRIQGAFQDISQQKEAEARALSLEAQLTATLESITDGFCLIDQDWKITFFNGQAERMLQRRREEVLGKTLWQEFPETRGTRMERECRLALREQRTTRFEAFYPPLNLCIHFHVYPTQDGLAIYFQDITRQRAEQSQLQLLQTAVSRLNDIVIITEAVALDEGGRRIVFVNEAFERQTGYSREDVLGQTSRLLCGPNTQRSELDRICAAMAGREAVRAEIVIYAKDASERWLETDIAPIAGKSGKFTHWVAVGRDITERRQQQQEILSLNNGLEARVLLRTFELERANRELESFAYSVSHDLRTPLSSIHAFSQLVVKVDGGQVSAKGQHYLERIGVGVKHMGDLIEGLLTLADVSRKQIESKPVDLSDIARRIGRNHHAQEPGRQAVLQIQDGLSAQGDARLLSVVFQNLLGNAWKFTSREPLARIQVGGEPDFDGNTVFFVRDNGAGFDMAFAPKLFGTFERLHSPEEFSGTGIGLATVKRIIERHGGRVWAESTPNEGAAFFFTLGRTREALP
ncbi:PAS domain S-box protein [Polaromonas sp. CG_9.11]|uniref:PAS domain-containing sensor histidine kinase n=1 Tax=Polaromonas sp. CG_9.11 TaxID=2787730 RepID=UPI001A1DE48E|nr:PAS domain S-box-containing protein [Polaromonas sp. CG_9.11]